MKHLYRLSHVTFFFVLFFFFVILSSAEGQEESDFALRAVPDFPPGSEPEVAVGASYVVNVQLSSEAAGLEAWSFGLCVDTTQQEIVSAAEGGDLGRVLFGNPPEFYAIDTWTEEGRPHGVTEAVVLDLHGGSALGAIPSDSPISVLSVELKPHEDTAGTDVSTTFCNDVGTPAVETLFVLGNEGYVPAVQEGSTVSVVRDPPTLIAFSKESYNLALTTGSVEVTIRIRSTFKLYGFSFGMACDGDLLKIRSVSLAQALVDALEGQEPDFWAVNTSPAGGSGFTAGVVFDIPEEGSSPVEDLLWIKSDKTNPSTEAFKVVLEAGPQAADGKTTELTFTDQLGSPPVAVLFDLGQEHRPHLRGAAVVITEKPQESPFRRGDINGDGRYNVADASKLLRYLFADQPVGFDCHEAIDVNNDKSVNIADAIYLLTYLFLNGPPPSAPFPDCGSLPADDPDFTGCESYPACEG